MALMAYWTGEFPIKISLFFLVGPRHTSPRGLCDTWPATPTFACWTPRMEFRSLDFAASECDGPQALTRSHPVPACIDFCTPQHPLPGRQYEASRA